MSIINERWSPGDVIVLYQEDGQKDAREVLAHAAPDMARALMKFREAYLSQDSVEDMERALQDADAALTKAGVPLP